MTQDQKFETIIESYVNGNISEAKTEVKKLRMADRKKLYLYILSEKAWKDYVATFFFELI